MIQSTVRVKLSLEWYPWLSGTMFLIYLAAFIAACGAAKLDRTYLPPPSAAFAGGSPGSLQVPFTRAIDQASQIIPAGSFVNEHQGVVVEVATAATRASSKQSGLGESRDTYGSTDSKVGDAAFRTTSNQQQNHNSNFGSVHGEEPDLSAFYQPSSSYKPGNVQIIRDYVSDTIKYHNDIDLNNFNYGFETNNGIKASGSGVATNGVKVQGGYSYTGDDGRVYSVSYTADEHGFRPQGSHLPTPPPIPLAILKSLEQNAKDEAAGIIDDGSYDAKKYNDGGYYTKSDANGEYNDRQSNKFGERPGSSDGSGTFINQNHQAFVTSNFNGQFGFIHDSSKGKFNSEPFKYSGANHFNIMNNRNTLPNIEHNNKLIYDRFGSRNEYLPPNRVQFDSTFLVGGNKDSFGIPQPNLQQNLPAQGQFSKPQFNIMRPSSFDISPGITSQPAFNSHISSFPSNDVNNQGSMSSFINDKNVSPSMSSQPHNKPLPENSGASNFMNQNPKIMQQSMIASNNNKPILTQESFSQSFASASSSSTSQAQSQQFLSTSGSFNPNVNTIVQSQYTNLPSSSFDTSFSSVGPTVQSQIILTSPFETPKIRDPSTLLDNGKTELLNHPTISSGSFNPSVNTFGQPQYTHVPIASYNSSLSSVIPTVQPQITLTTPFETPKTEDPFTLLDNGKTELLNPPTISSGSFNPSVNTFGQPQYTHVPIAIYNSSLSSVIPTVQPQITLTTPFETPKTGEPTTLFDFRNTEFLNTTTVPNLTVTNPNIRLPTTQLSTAPSGSFNLNGNIIEQAQYTHIPISNVDTSFPSVVPTSQPQITLTTPFEASKTGELSTLLDFGKTELLNTTTVPDFTMTDSQSSKFSGPTGSNKQQFPTQPPSTISGNIFLGFSTSSFDTSPQSTSLSFDNTQTTQFSQNSTPQVTQAIFVSNRQGETEVSTITQAPTYNSQSNNFNSQTQAADHSYIYNQPSIAFNTPIIQSNNVPSGLPSLQFDKATQSLTPQDSTSTTQYLTQSTFNNSPIPSTIIPNISSYTTLRENEPEKSTLQAFNGITQASISNFPSVISTDSSGFKEPFQQSELSTPSQSSFPQPSTTSATETAEVVSTLSDTQNEYTDSQLSVKDKMNNDLNKISNQQYTNEIYQYNKPAQELPSQTEKEGGELSIKTERPQFTVSSSQFSQEGSSLSMDQNTIQGESETPQTIFNRFNQHDIPNPTEQSVQFGTQPATISSTVAQQGLNSNEYTISQFQQHTSPGIAISNYKPSTLSPSTLPTNTLNTEKLEGQTSTTLLDNPTIGLQSTTQFDGFSIKETTPSHFQQTNQQTETQLNYQPSTSIPGASQTTPEMNEQTQFTSISQMLGTQSSTQFNQESYTNKATTLPQFQQTVTQYTYKPSTLISNVDQSTFDGFNTQNPDKQYSLSTSFVQPTVTDEVTQSGTQEYQGSMDRKQTTISHFQAPSHQMSTTFSQPSTLIPSTTQTETPPGATQFGEIYDYKKPTESFITPQNVNNGPLSPASQQFGIQTNMGPQTMPIIEKEITMQFGQQTQQPQFNTQPSTQYNQDVTEKVTTQFNLAQNEAVTGLDYNTGSTIISSSPQFQMTSNTQVPDQTSTSEEVYEYTKPAQGLPQQTESEHKQFDHKIQMQPIGELTTIPVESTFEIKQTTTSQSTEGPISTSATFQTESSLNSQTTNTLTSQPELTQETLSGTIPSVSPPQFSFYSACCKGIKTESTTSANEIQASGLNPNTQNMNMDQVTEKNKIEEKQNFNLSALLEPQKGSQTYAGIGEEFGGPRKPPSFDKTGYHY